MRYTAPASMYCRPHNPLIGKSNLPLFRPPPRGSLFSLRSVRGQVSSTSRTRRARRVGSNKSSLNLKAVLAIGCSMEETNEISGKLGFLVCTSCLSESLNPCSEGLQCHSICHPWVMCAGFTSRWNTANSRSSGARHSKLSYRSIERAFRKRRWTPSQSVGVGCSRAPQFSADRCTLTAGKMHHRRFARMSRIWRGSKSGELTFAITVHSAARLHDQAMP
jgi:hypothetical protein